MEYEMTKDQLDEILRACKPVLYIATQCGEPSSQRENANRAWERLGKEMGFEFMTVLPSKRGDRFFTANESEAE